MAKFDLKLKALVLRRKGLSIGNIATDLGVSKGTVSLWCRNLELTSKQRERLRQNSIRGGHRGRILGALKNKQKKLDNIKLATEWGNRKIGSLSKRDRLMLGLALYWAEGTKSSNSNLTFVNSDPVMIVLMFNWFMEFLDVKKEDFIVRVSINEIHQPRIETVFLFWSKLLGLPKDQFRRPTYIKVPPKKVYENYDKYYGIISLRFRRSSISMYRTLGLIEAVKKLA